MSASLRLVHITFGAGAGAPIDVKAVEEALRANVVDWMHYLTNCYVVWTYVELASLTNALRGVPNMEKGYFFITAIDPESPLEGWLPPWAWDWLHKFRHHHASAPSLQQPVDFPELRKLLGDPNK